MATTQLVLITLGAQIPNRKAPLSVEILYTILLFFSTDHVAKYTGTSDGPSTGLGLTDTPNELDLARLQPPTQIFPYLPHESVL